MIEEKPDIKIKDEKYPNGFRIEYPGLNGLDEFAQAIWEDIQALKSNGVEYVKDAQIFVPITNKYGEKRVLRTDDGNKPRYWTSHAYKSAAWEYGL